MMIALLAAVLGGSPGPLPVGVTQDTVPVATTIPAPPDTSSMRRDGARTPVLLLGDATQQRPRAVDYSDWYERRLTIHRMGSYVELPLFAAEYVLGQRLLTGTNVSSSIRSAHGALAGGLGVLFAVNTLTGGWNFWDSRRDNTGATRRLLHSLLMLGADAGFAVAGQMADDSGESVGAADRHRNAALVSIGLASAGTLMMWLWKN